MKSEGGSPVDRVKESESDELARTWARRVEECSSRDVGDVANTMRGAMLHFEKEGGAGVDRALRGIDMDKADEYHVAAALRALCEHRKELPSWAEVVRSAAAAFAARGLDVEEYLGGLPAREL